jgi:hypothetical protein
MMRIGMGLMALVGLGVAVPAQGQMSLPGKFEVTDTGSASYTIPIGIVPGTAGLEPKLSLQYDSRSGNGLLGVGWSLAGLPAITRCGRTIAQDGQAGGVSYDANDRFCLDGQRLVALDGATYGADQTEYRTERESFSKVVSYGTAGSGPSWFKVWTKAGLIMEFGNTADSKIEAQGKASVRVWAINKTSDTKSNYFTVSYTEDSANGEYRPDHIDYTGNATANTQPTNSVRFVYEARPDVVPMYQAGSLIKTTQRLARAEVWRADSMVRSYRLSYDAPNFLGSRLSNIELCPPNQNCLNAINVTFNDGGPHESLSSTYEYLLSGQGASYERGFADFNGDGLADAVQYGIVNQNWVIYVALGRGDGTFHPATVNPPIRGGLGASYQHAFADFNGDGRVDAAIYGFLSDQRWVTSIALGRGDGTFESSNYIYHRGGLGASYGYAFTDFNGDGRTDAALYGVVNQVWVASVALRATGSYSISSISGTAMAGTTISYKHLSLSPDYIKDTGASACTYPCVDLQGPLYVVSEVRSSNGLGIAGSGGEYRSTYRYAGAKSDSHGRGFLGFRQMTVKDEQTGVEQVTTYRQDYPFTGLVASREKTLGTQLLNRSSNTYSSTSLGGTRRYPYLTQSLEESWELTTNGGQGAALPAVTTAYQYDTFGNATQVGVSTGDGHGKTTLNTYSNDTANWLLGRLTRSEVTSTTPGN